MKKASIIFTNKLAQQNFINKLEALTTIKSETFDSVNQVNIEHKNLIVVIGVITGNTIIHIQGTRKTIEINNKDISEVMIF